MIVWGLTGMSAQFRQYRFFLFTYLYLKPGPGTWLIATVYLVPKTGNAANH